MQTHPENDSTPEPTETNSLSLSLDTSSTRSNPIEYTTSGTELTLTIKNTSDTPVEPGEAFLELITTAHAIATPPPERFASMDAPHTWELTEKLPAHTTIETTITLATDSLPRDKWHGQLDIIANVGMDITTKKTAFIYG